MKNAIGLLVIVAIVGGPLWAGSISWSSLRDRWIAFSANATKFLPDQS